jgi:2-dehydropantoate 2-reductase
MSTQLKDVLLVGFGAVGAVCELVDHLLLRKVVLMCFVDSLILKRSNLARVTIVARSNYDLVNRELLRK